MVAVLSVVAGPLADKVSLAARTFMLSFGAVTLRAATLRRVKCLAQLRNLGVPVQRSSVLPFLLLPGPPVPVRLVPALDLLEEAGLDLLLDPRLLGDAALPTVGVHAVEASLRLPFGVEEGSCCSSDLK